MKNKKQTKTIQWKIFRFLTIGQNNFWNKIPAFFTNFSFTKQNGNGIVYTWPLSYIELLGIATQSSPLHWVRRYLQRIVPRNDSKKISQLCNQFGFLFDTVVHFVIFYKKFIKWHILLKVLNKRTARLFIFEISSCEQTHI